ncbi:MAG: hypothetical protein EAZ66_05990 [Alphaproteobacteria bacterium]|nr:MAG: hypothetical protein EAZ66_05990 [Alphaproteobacteria bacterium]
MDDALPNTAAHDPDALHSKAMRHLEQLKHPNAVNDLAFLGQHALTCLLTDVATVPFTALINKHVELKKDGAPFSFTLDLHSQKPFKGLEFSFGEVFGDVAAIPITFALERCTPKIMNALRTPMEAAFGMFYRDSAQKAADQWADHFGIERGTKEHYEYKQAHFDKEMNHAPQMLVWTASSMLTGALAQNYFMPLWNKETIGSTQDFFNILASNIAGKVITAIAANGTRLAAPQTTDHLEHKLNELAHRFIPHSDAQANEARSAPDHHIAGHATYEQTIRDASQEKSRN